MQKKFVCVIEHPTRGVFVGWHDDGKPHFRWSISRNAGKLFVDRIEAEKELKRLPEKVKEKSYIHFLQ